MSGRGDGKRSFDAAACLELEAHELMAAIAIQRELEAVPLIERQVHVTELVIDAVRAREWSRALAGIHILRGWELDAARTGTAASANDGGQLMLLPPDR